MGDQTDNFTNRLKDIYELYIGQLPSIIEEIEQSCKVLVSQPGWEKNHLNKLAETIHTLAGSSSTFGLSRLGEASRRLEAFFLDLSQSANHLIFPTSDQKAELNSILKTLLEAVEEKEKPAFLSYSEAKALKNQLKVKTPARAGPHLIYLIDQDEGYQNNLEQQINYFGYKVKSFSGFPELKESLKIISPSALILDINLLKDQEGGKDQIRKFREEMGARVPLIFISSSERVEARLEAVRAGGIAYFVKTFDPNELIDKLDELILNEDPQPYRVLIVENDLSLGSYYALTLNQAGILTEVVSNPLKIMDPLTSFMPDLILTDLYMPHCDGLELAAVIRQQPLFVSVPIVFLSSETNVEKHLDALRLGGDDFLTKPIKPARLISQITSRAKRSRNLRSLMIRDSLTGLFNHTSIKERLASEIALARRNNSSLAFAMLDLDKFKQINDTYGHPTGDRVIKSLSRLLQQRLRQVDVVGRYGGEEFAIIMLFTDGPNAEKVLNEIREGFAKIRHLSQNEHFFVTFSGGIATFTGSEDAARLNDLADKALYEAKKSGRNRIVLSEGHLD